MVSLFVLHFALKSEERTLNSFCRVTSFSVRNKSPRIFSQTFGGRRMDRKKGMDLKEWNGHGESEFMKEIGVYLDGME